MRPDRAPFLDRSGCASIKGAFYIRIVFMDMFFKGDSVLTKVQSHGGRNALPTPESRYNGDAVFDAHQPPLE